MSNEQADQEAGKAAGRASAFFEMRRKDGTVIVLDVRISVFVFVSVALLLMLMNT